MVDFRDDNFPIGDKPGLNGPPDPPPCDECGAVAWNECGCSLEEEDVEDEEDE